MAVSSLKSTACRLAVLALLAAACAPATTPPASELAAQASAAPSLGSTPSQPASTPSPTALPDRFDIAGVGWESEFVFMEPHGFGAIKGVVAGAGRFVMWSDEANGRPGFLVTDGAGWMQIDTTVTGRTMLTVVADHAGLLGLATGPGGLVEAWRSADGATWTNTPMTGIDGTPSALVVTGSSYVAVGRDRSGCGLMAWTSVDASTWTAAGTLPETSSPCGSIDTRPIVDQLVGGSQGLLALGRLANGDAALWTSSDGSTWQRTAGPSSGHVAAITAGGAGFVMVGDDDGTPARAAAWTSRSSAEGFAWTTAPPQASFGSATMSNVVALADGRLASVGLERSGTGARRFVAWTSADGLTWQRSPDTLCQNLGVCDDGGVQPPLLASDGHRLVAFDGGINILASPRVTPGLRPGSLALGFDHPPAGTWRSGLATGYCLPSGDPAGGVQLGVAYPRLLDVGPASGSSTYNPSLILDLRGDGSVLDFRYDRGDDAGFTVEATGGAGLDPSASGGLDHVAVDAGSTALDGRLEFRGLTVTRLDMSLPAIPPVSGWITWSCGR